MAKLLKKVGKNRGTGADLVQIVNENTSRYTTRLELEQEKNAKLQEIVDLHIGVIPITLDILESELLRRTAGNTDPEIQRQVQHFRQVAQAVRGLCYMDQEENQ